MHSLNAAVLTSLNKFRNALWLPVIPLLLVQMMSGMRDMPQFAFFLIFLQEQVGLEPVAISSLVAGAQVAGMVTAILGGAIASRLGRKWVLICGLALSGLSSLVFRGPSLWVVTVLWLIGGTGMALVTIGAASFLTQISARGTLGILAAFYALSMTVGGAIGNPLAALIIEKSGFSAFSWAAMALSTGAILVVTFWMPPSEKTASEPASLQSFWTGVQFTVKGKNVRLLVGLRCLPTIFYGMLTVLIPLLINELLGSKVIVAAFGTTSLIVASAAQLLAGRAADRRGARFPTVAAYAVIIISGIGLAFASGTGWGLFVFGILGNAAAWSLSTMMYVWVGDRVPKSQHPATFGLLHAVWSLSMITGSVLGGWFVTSTPGLPFLITGLMNIGSFFLIRAYYAHKAGKDAALSPTEI